VSNATSIDESMKGSVLIPFSSGSVSNPPDGDEAVYGYRLNPFFIRVSVKRFDFGNRARGEVLIPFSSGSVSNGAKILALNKIKSLNPFFIRVSVKQKFCVGPAIFA